MTGARRGPLAPLLEPRAEGWVEVWDRELPAAFGPVATELASFAGTVALLDTSYRGVIDLVGAGVEAFLEKIVSCHVPEVTASRGRRACLLSAKGRLLGAFQLHRIDERTFRAIFDEPARGTVITAFSRYGFLSDIEVREVEELAVLSLRGPASTVALGASSAAASSAAPEPESAERPADLARRVVVLDLPAGALETDAVAIDRRGESGEDVWVPVDRLAEVWEHLESAARASGGCAVGWTAAERARIESGRALQGLDYEEDLFPGEVGEEDALTYDKCYVGQEVVARTRTYGQVAKRLCRFASELPVPPGTRVLAGESEAGSVTSFDPEGLCGLALVKRRHWAAPELVTPEGVKIRLRDVANS